MARITPPVMALLRKDPHGAVVMALEVFDDVEQTARPATLLQQRVVVPRPVAHGADTPGEAVALSMDRVGRVDLSLVADLLGVDVTEARAQLGTLVAWNLGLRRSRAEHDHAGAGVPVWRCAYAA